MSTERTIYRTTRPDLLALWEKWQGWANEFAEQVQAFITEYAPEGSQAMVSEFAGKRVAGVSIPSWDQQHRYLAKKEQPPEGWRYDRKNGTLVPARSTKQGKKIAAAMDAIQSHNYRGDLLGMPYSALLETESGIALCHPGVEMHGGAMYVIWSNGGPTQGIDPEIWERVKLSEWYAIKEAKQEMEAADA